MQAAIAAFLRHLDRERNASPHTVRAYGDDLAQFAGYLERELGRAPRPQDVDHLLIRGFLAGAAPARPRKSSSPRASSRRLRTLLPLPLPRGRARREPGARPFCRRAWSSGSPPCSTRRRSRRSSRCRVTVRRPSAAAPSWSCSTRPASAAPSSWRSTWTSSTSGRAWSGCSARAERSAWCRSADARSRRFRRWLEERPRLKPRNDALFVNARGGRLSDRSVRTLVAQRVLSGGTRPPLQPAHAPPQLRDPPAGARGRPARDPGAARPLQPLHHPALHPRQYPPPARGV